MVPTATAVEPYAAVLDARNGVEAPAAFVDANRAPLVAPRTEARAPESKCAIFATICEELIPR